MKMICLRAAVAMRPRAFVHFRNFICENSFQMLAYINIFYFEHETKLFKQARMRAENYLFNIQATILEQQIFVVVNEKKYITIHLNMKLQ